MENNNNKKKTPHRSFEGLCSLERHKQILAAVKNPTVVYATPVYTTPSPIDHVMTKQKKRAKVFSMNTPNKRDPTQETLTQTWSDWTGTDSPIINKPYDRNVVSSSTSKKKNVLKGKIHGTSSFNDHAYPELAESEDINLLHIRDVVQHNAVIQNELRDLERLTELRKLPLFSVEEMRSTHSPVTLGEDPRGWQPVFDWETDKPPTAEYCQECRCTLPNCHDKAFSFYMELRVVQHIDHTYAHGSISELVEEDVSEVLKRAYNEYLRIRLFESRRLLDSYTDYSMPKCVTEGMAHRRAMNYFQFKQYSFIMEKRVE